MAVKILITTGETVDPQEIRRGFADLETEYVFESPKAEQEVISACEGCDAIIIGPDTPITGKVLRRLNSLKVVGRAGIGLDNVDVVAAEEEEVTVVNAPEYCLDEVSNHALSLLLACHRRLPIFDSAVRDGRWDWQAGGRIDQFSNQTVGLVGFGKIARRLTSKLNCLDVDVIAHDPFIAADEMDHSGAKKVSFDDLLDRSGLISIHAPLTAETEHLFDAETIDAMRNDAALVNTSRGGLIDEEALVRALTTGELGLAGLDVYEDEPDVTPELLDLENVILTPHVAWYSEASRASLARTVSADVAAVLSGEDPQYLVV